MDFYKIFDQHKDTSDKTGNLFTIIIYDLSLEKIIELLSHKIEIAKTIKNPKKRSFACKRIYLFKEYIKELKNKLVNSIFLVSDVINEIKLDKSWLDILYEYNVENFIFKHGEIYDLKFLKSLFTDLSYKNIICIKNNHLSHIYLNPSKKKIYYQEETKGLNIENYLNKIDIKEKCLIHGVSVALKNYKSDFHLIYTKMLKDEEIFEIFRKEDVSEKQKQLQSFLDFIDNVKLSQRLIFGKNISQKIINMELQYIFCSPEMHSKIINKIQQKYLNFNLIIVDSLEKGDIGDVLKTKYNGAIGVTYF